MSTSPVDSAVIPTIWLGSPEFRHGKQKEPALLRKAHHARGRVGSGYTPYRSDAWAWYDARHAIPLVGIILGTVMNAGSLAATTVMSTTTRERLAIEAGLALGATREEALRPILRHAVLAGLLPTMNEVAAASIITLPGIMRGQVLAGIDPLDAAKYQILLAFVLSTGGIASILGNILDRATRPSEMSKVNRAWFAGGSRSCEEPMTKRTPPFSAEVRE